MPSQPQTNETSGFYACVIKEEGRISQPRTKQADDLVFESSDARIQNSNLQIRLQPRKQRSCFIICSRGREVHCVSRRRLRGNRPILLPHATCICQRLAIHQRSGSLLRNEHAKRATRPELQPPQLSSRGFRRVLRRAKRSRI